MGSLGPYELVAEIGRGATAVVWRARDNALERYVAIKEPLLREGMSPEAREEYLARFASECKIIGSLNHPNIVMTFDAGVFDGRPAAVMELVEGETLAQMLARGPLSANEALDYTLQVLSGLAYAHARGVVHRDLKPANVFVTPAGRIKLMDFGIACAPGDTMRGRLGGVAGSPGYLAPEQVRGAAANIRGDVFTVGVLLYEMLVGRNPFEAGNPILTIENTLSLPVPFVSASGVSATINGVIARATAKDPAQRYASPAEMAAALSSAPAVSAGGGVPKAVWFGVGAVAVAGAIGAVALLASPSTPTTVQSGVVVSTAGGTASADAAAAGGASATGVGAAAQTQTQPSLIEQEAEARRKLEDALAREFSRIDASVPWRVSDVQIARDSSGRWWGIGGQRFTDSGYVGSWAVMVDDGSGWRSYGLVYEEYELYWEGSPREQIPSEVRSVLFAALPAFWTN